MKEYRFTLHLAKKNHRSLKLSSLKGKQDSTGRVIASPTMILSDVDKTTALKKSRELKLNGIDTEILVSPSNISKLENGEIANFDFSSGEAYDPNNKIVGQINGCEVVGTNLTASRIRIMTRFGRNVKVLNKKSLKFGPDQSNVKFSIPNKYSETTVFVVEMRFLVSSFSENRINLLEGQSPGFSISIRKNKNKNYLHFSVATNEGWKSFAHYSTPLSLNQWHEAAFIFKSGEISVILDSHLISKGNVPAKNLKPVGNKGIFVGTWVDGQRNQFIGKLQFLKLWSTIPQHLLKTIKTNEELDSEQGCGYKLNVKASVKIGSFIFPGQSTPTQIKYRSLDGLIVLDGGIILGEESVLL